MGIAWRIRWRGDEYAIRWNDGVLDGDAAAADAFGRYVVSNAPMTDVPPEQRMGDAALVRAMMAEFADAILELRGE